MNVKNIQPWLTLKHWKNLNPYHGLRAPLFYIEPQKAHDLTLKFLQKGFLPKIKNDQEKILSSKVWGINFPNPLGLAAGFDKNAEIITEAQDLGFGFIELGSITPHPQAGNPTPRLFRAPHIKAVINRFGFNSHGIDIVLRRIIAWHDGHVKKDRGIVGINLGKNKDSSDATADYITGFKAFAPYASYITINISSPNTTGLRDLQSRVPLTNLLQQVMAVHAAYTFKPPVFVKIAPDQTDQQLEDIAEVVLASGVHGMIISNTTLARPSALPAELIKESGGLSGKPLFEPSTDVLRRMYKLTQGKVPLIGCGGVFSAEDAYAKILAGASLVQLYTGLVYEGPFLIKRINQKLAELLKRDGFSSLSEAVGAEHNEKHQ